MHWQVGVPVITETIALEGSKVIEWRLVNCQSTIGISNKIE